MLRILKPSFMPMLNSAWAAMRDGVYHFLVYTDAKPVDVEKTV
jgi:hypothetical protein